MEGVVNAENGSGADVNDSVEESRSIVVKDKGKSSMNGKGEDMDAIMLSVSDPTLVEGLKVLENPTFENSRSSKM